MLSLQSWIERVFLRPSIFNLQPWIEEFFRPSQLVNVQSQFPSCKRLQTFASALGTRKIFTISTIGSPIFVGIINIVPPL